MLPWFVVLGVACGLLAVVVSKGLFLVEDGFRRLPVNDFWHPVIGAVGFALVGLLVPRVLGVGYDAIGDVLNDKLTVGVIAVLAVAKLVAWWIALGSGTSGGTLAPLLLIGGSFGSLVGYLAAALEPGLGLSPGAFAVVGMAATFGASTRATFTSIVFLFELTRDYQVIVPLMLAAVVADLIAAALMHETLMTEKLARRGLRVQTEYEVDVLRTTTVREVMTREVQTLPATATVGDARRKLGAGIHSAYPVVDVEGRCLGMVSRGDLLRRPAEDSDPVTAIASRDVVSVSPEDAVFRALQRILEEEVEHLPVVEAAASWGSVPARTSSGPAAASSSWSAGSPDGGCWALASPSSAPATPAAAPAWPPSGPSPPSWSRRRAFPAGRRPGRGRPWLRR
jgi:predicted transcriptional regulator